MAIMVNQVGYEADALGKKAVVSRPGSYVLKNAAGEEAWQGETGTAVQDPLCGETLYPLDFGSVRAAGKYYLEDGQGEHSDTFEIGKDVYAGVHNAMVKALYFQRCGCALEENTQVPTFMRPAIWRTAGSTGRRGRRWKPGAAGTMPEIMGVISLPGR